MTNDTAQETREAPDAEDAQNAPDAQDAAQDAAQDGQAGQEAKDVQDMEINLGRCHYGDFDEDAVAVAASTDGGWIAVCEEHKQRAQEDGYEVQDGDKAPDGD